MFLTKKLIIKIILAVYTLTVVSYVGACPHYHIKNYSDKSFKTKEDAIGEKLLKMLYQQNAISNDELINQYLSNLGNKLISYSPLKKQKFNFFAINDEQFNAFAFFGGNVGVHLGAISTLESEGELAAVMSHEIAHISQNHLTRQIEQSNKLLPISIIEAVAAIALGMPNLAIVAMGTHQQQMLHYSREFEKEADRIGMKILTNAGFSPHYMANVFYQMQQKFKYQSKPPEYLITHPLHENRIADARNRASSFPYRQNVNSEDFLLVQARVNVLISNNLRDLIKRLAYNVDNNRYTNELAANYALSLAYFMNNQAEEALKIITPYLEQNNENLFVQLLLSDIYLSKGKLKDSLLVLEKIYKIYPEHSAVKLKLAKNYLLLKNPDKTKKIITELANQNKSLEAYDLLARAENQENNKVRVHINKAKWHMMRGESQRALRQLEIALEFNKRDIYVEQEIANLKQEINLTLKSSIF